jgi:hypothetical protein
VSRSLLIAPWATVGWVIAIAMTASSLRSPSVVNQVSAIESARAALVQLRASAGLTGADRPRSYYMNSSGKELTEEDAVRALARIPKPVRCVAEATGGAMRISTFKLDNDADRELQHLTGQLGGLRFVDVVRKNYGCRAPDSPVLLRGGGQSVVVPLAVVARLMREYLIEGEVSSLGPDSEARAAQACAVIVFRRTGGVMVQTRDAPP